MSQAALETVNAVLGEGRVWLVGGAVRDRLLGRATDDLDLVVDGDVRAAALALARHAGAAAFELSDAHGAWRVVERAHRWQADLSPLREGAIEANLRARDFTVNAIAEPLGGGEPIDPTGGLADLHAGRLRMVDPAAFAADPLRTLRLPRFVSELDLAVEAATMEAARAEGAALTRVAAERVFAELRRIVAAPGALRGLALMDELGLHAAVLPELAAMHGVVQNPFHHLDVYDHTLAVLEGIIELERDPTAVVGETHAAAVAALLAEPLADQVTRATALRFGALLHDAAKPSTRRVDAEGRVTFLGHDREGARLAVAVLGRLRASERLQTHVAALTRHHLRLGFLVHEQPLGRRAVYRYLDVCDPVAVDVTLLSMADRLATLGRNAEQATARHLDLARALLEEALRWRARGRPGALVRGDELARALGVPPGPVIGELLAALEEARFAGEVGTREEAIELARARLHDGSGTAGTDV